MLAKILIERQFKSGNEKEIVSLLNQLRALAMNQPGYISGLTMRSPDKPENMMVIGTWQTLESWYSWKENMERKNLEAMLDIYQEKTTEYREYVVGSGLLT
ncbi:antibiotic biosynthesis monooxygenase family protein [Thermodesulfobacteriota bacterium]